MAAVVIGDHELPTVALFDVMQMACIQFQVCVPTPIHRDCIYYAHTDIILK